VMSRSKPKPSAESLIVKIIRKAVGEEVDVVTPQFTRPDGEPPPANAPEGFAGFDALRGVDPVQLRAMGMRRWGRQEDANEKEFGPMLWLFPGEWYRFVPDGYTIVDIFFVENKFVLGETDDDIRFGCLSFGILVDE
jgi:hypothetical protein